MKQSALRILVVDDDPDLLATMCDIFTLKGFESIPIRAGGAALTIIENKKIDVAIIDLCLGDMPGISVLKGIKTRSTDTECIMLTGFASQDSAIDAINAGAYSYFQKPCAMDQLILSIQRAGEKQHLALSLKESEARYRAIASLSSDFSYSCLHSGEAGNMADWITDAFFILSGYSEAELREQGCWMFVVHPEDREEATEPHRRLRAGESDSREFRIVTKTGDIRWFANHMECRSEPDLPDQLRFLGAVKDITERKRAEELVKSQLAELISWQDVMLGREDRVRELKREINELCGRLGQDIRYLSQESEPGETWEEGQDS
jgi:PAS domain S-box-containing protein